MVRFPEDLLKGRPIVIEDYDPDWPLSYEKERQEISAKLGDAALAIEHIGSTSVPGLAARPTIDIIVLIASLELARECIPLIESLHYNYSPELEQVFSDRIFYWKGTAEAHTVHLAMIERARPAWDSLIAFRAYLRSHPSEAVRYETLKRALADKHITNVNQYSSGKEDYVASIQAKVGNDRG